MKIAEQLLTMKVFTELYERDVEDTTLDEINQLFGTVRKQLAIEGKKNVNSSELFVILQDSNLVGEASEFFQKFKFDFARHLQPPVELSSNSSLAASVSSSSSSSNSSALSASFTSSSLMSLPSLSFSTSSSELTSSSSSAAADSQGSKALKRELEQPSDEEGHCYKASKR